MLSYNRRCSPKMIAIALPLLLHVLATRALFPARFPTDLYDWSSAVKSSIVYGSRKPFRLSSASRARLMLRRRLLSFLEGLLFCFILGDYLMYGVDRRRDVMDLLIARGRAIFIYITPWRSDLRRCTSVPPSEGSLRLQGSLVPQGVKGSKNYSHRTQI